MNIQSSPVKVIGLTGGIGSGKTAVSDRFATHGIAVIDADIASREVVEKGEPALNRISEHFGSEALLEDGALNRAYLRKRIFDAPEEKQWLEALLHPLIRDRIIQQINRFSQDPEYKPAYLLLVSPLLLETNQWELVDRILVVDVPREVQLARTTARDNCDPKTIEAIIAAQSPRDFKLERADDIIENTGSLNDLHNAVEKLHNQYNQA
ncbi:dephospho-CoA kinase [Oleiphilus messinensis]|uniref:Dephospho-CoA kinase n=1 Tax=Oleiphilus messinensis TaxID=141451 RepID=A0A1Y0I733_9GAMM|nr:dephospho-CoA kinase [Oleiphilus messinensis]ARU55999.1 dephospho-CoA kinase [Oleiphilus messinensis]